MDTSLDTTGSETSESTATQSTESTGQGQVETQGSQGQTDIAGGEQSSTEGGKGQGTDTRKPFRSKNQTIYELRQGLRERDRQIQELGERFSQFEQKFKQRGQAEDPSQEFWKAPHEFLGNQLSQLEERLLTKLHEARANDQQTMEWKQETSDAAKLIQNQKGITEDDIADIQEILRANPAMENMRPKERAEYALFLWQRERGIQDNSGLKHKAASVQSGAPSQGGKRQWTKNEMEAELKKLPPDPRTWTADHEKRWKEMDSEFRSAHIENRVR